MGLLRLFRPHPMPRPKGSAAVLEDRRRRALALVDSGYTLNQAARQIGCSSSSVVYWFHARRRGGEKALHVRFSPGRPRKLTPRQERPLIQLLAQGPLKRGYRTNVWTSKRIAQLIDEEFGICYHPNHIGRLMFRLGWSHQKPKKHAAERDPEKIERWKRKKWPRIKKSRGAGRPRSFRRRVRIHAHSQRG
jgi:transposase